MFKNIMKLLIGMGILCNPMLQAMETKQQQQLAAEETVRALAVDNARDKKYDTYSASAQNLAYAVIEYNNHKSKKPADEKGLAPYYREQLHIFKDIANLAERRYEDYMHWVNHDEISSHSDDEYFDANLLVLNENGEIVERTDVPQNVASSQSKNEKYNNYFASSQKLCDRVIEYEKHKSKKPVDEKGLTPYYREQLHIFKDIASFAEKRYEDYMRWVNHDDEYYDADLLIMKDNPLAPQSDRAKYRATIADLRKSVSEESATSNSSNNDEEQISIQDTSSEQKPAFNETQMNNKSLRGKAAGVTATVLAVIGVSVYGAKTISFDQAQAKLAGLTSAFKRSFARAA